MTAERLPDDDLDRTREHWVEGEVLEGEEEGDETEGVRWVGGVPPLPDWPHTNGL
jgi:hypothetical protein